MKNKILIVITIIVFIIGMIVLTNYLNNVQEKEINNVEENQVEENKIEIMKVTNSNFEEEVLNSKKIVLIEFYADWCKPCRIYAPTIARFAAENEDIKVVKVNIDDSQDLAIKYQAMSIPTTVVIKDGKEINRAVGIMNKSELEQMVNEN